MTETSFDRAISEHLALCERNKRLESRMPLEGYRDQVGGGSAADTAAAAPIPEAPGAGREGSADWLDQSSFWDTTAERPVPEFDWGD